MFGVIYSTSRVLNEQKEILEVGIRTAEGTFWQVLATAEGTFW